MFRLIITSEFFHPSHASRCGKTRLVALRFTMQQSSNMTDIQLTDGTNSCLTNVKYHLINELIYWFKDLNFS